MQKSFAAKVMYWLEVVSLGLVLGIGVQFAHAWTVPTDVPPGGVLPSAPLTTGGMNQTKSAGLGLTGSLVVGGNASVGGSAVVSTNLVVSNASTLNGSVIMNSGLVVNGSGSTLMVNGNIVSPAGTISALSGDVVGKRICIANDCRGVWPTGTVTGTGTDHTLTMWGAGGTAGMSNMSQDAAGNLHTSNINAKLFYGTNNSERVVYMDTADVATASYRIAMWGDDGRIGESNMRQDLNGNVTVNPTAWIKASGFFNSSDRRLKENIETLNSSVLDKVLRLNGVSFRWKEDGRKDVGLIAQDVEKVFPEIVKTDPETGLKSVEYGNLVAPLIEAVKTQQQEIDALKAEMESLKK